MTGPILSFVCESQKLDRVVIEGYASESNFRMVIPVADYYITNSISGKGDWFIDQAKTISGEGLYYYLGYLSEYFSRFPGEGEDRAIDFLLQNMESDTRSYIRLVSFQVLLVFSDEPETLKRINDVALL